MFETHSSLSVADDFRPADHMHAVDLPGALARGAIVVDIRAQAQRVTEGTLPGALAIERDVLERRCNPLSSDHLALAVGHDVEWIIVCSDGYASSIAAAALQQLGLRKATSLVGGYRAIKTAGLLGSLIAAKHCVREMATVTAH